MSKIAGQVYKSSVAKSTPYDDTIAIPISGTDNVQDILDYLKNSIGNSASPGFTFGRSGNLPTSTWLLNDSVPSNTCGRVNFLNDCFLRNIYCANQDAKIIKIGIYHHEGNEVNLTLLGTVTTLAQCTNSFAVSYSIPINKQIAIRIEPDSPNAGKNMCIGVVLKGTL